MSFDDESVVVPDGGTIRRMRRSRGWSRRALSEAIGDATERESGLRESVSINLIEWVEESNERLPYATLRHIASGLDCNPVELLGDAPGEGEAS